MGIHYEWVFHESINPELTPLLLDRQVSVPNCKGSHIVVTIKVDGIQMLRIYVDCTLGVIPCWGSVTSHAPVLSLIYCVNSCRD